MPTEVAFEPYPQGVLCAAVDSSWVGGRAGVARALSTATVQCQCWAAWPCAATEGACRWLQGVACVVWYGTSTGGDGLGGG